MESRFNEATKTFTYGVYAITTTVAGKTNAMTAVWVTQVAKDPTQVLVACQHGLTSTKMIEESRVFAVNVLAKGQEELIYSFGRSSGAEEDKLAGLAWETRVTGAPILTVAAAFLDCRLVDTVMTPTHRLFIGEVVEAGLDAAREPLAYRNGKML